jgi:hypothetical protein
MYPPVVPPLAHTGLDLLPGVVGAALLVGAGLLLRILVRSSRD